MPNDINNAIASVEKFYCALRKNEVPDMKSFASAELVLLHEANITDAQHKYIDQQYRNILGLYVARAEQAALWPDDIVAKAFVVCACYTHAPKANMPRNLEDLTAARVELLQSHPSQLSQHMLNMVNDLLRTSCKALVATYVTNEFGIEYIDSAFSKAKELYDTGEQKPDSSLQTSSNFDNLIQYYCMTAGSTKRGSDMLHALQFLCDDEITPIGNHHTHCD